MTLVTLELLSGFPDVPKSTDIGTLSKSNMRGMGDRQEFMP
jgi:hypothetical protein